MREIDLHKRLKVIRLFLSGLSFDDIAQQVGIAKGSVVNTINEFREGELAVPPDMAEYVDALRQLAVDLKKNNTSIAHIKSCFKLDVKLKEMDVSNEQVEGWLDICQDIASPAVSSSEFVKAALELAQMSSDSGLSYGDLVADYNSKVGSSKVLDKEIKQKEEELSQVKLKHIEEKEQAIRELDSLTKAIATAQDTFSKQKDDLKSQLNEYLVQNRLSWRKVNTAVTLFDIELGKSGLLKRDIDQLSERIRHTGSLVNVIRQLEQEKGRQQSETAKLVQEAHSSTDSVNELREISKSLHESISTNIQKSDKLITELKSKRAELESKETELEKLKQTISQYTHNLYISRLILDFLFAPSSLSNYDLDRLVGLMIALRQNRLGIEPKQVTDANGNVICECQIPRLYGSIKMQEADIDNVRVAFAHFLTPLVKDKFVSRFDYDMAEIRHETSKIIAVNEAIIEERSRHII